MPKSEKQHFSKKIFIDYIPAELKQTKNGDWRIVNAVPYYLLLFH